MSHPSTHRSAIALVIASILSLAMLAPSSLRAEEAALSEEEPAPPPLPNDLSLGLGAGGVSGGVLGGLLPSMSTGLVLGLGLGESWRGELDVQGSYARSSFDATGAEGVVQPTRLTRSNLGGGIALHRLFGLGGMGRGYLGVRLGAGFSGQDSEDSEGGEVHIAQYTVLAGPVLGAEYLLGGRLGLGLEVGLQGYYQWPREQTGGLGPLGGIGPDWGARSTGRATLRYYF